MKSFNYLKTESFDGKLTPNDLGENSIHSTFQGLFVFSFSEIEQKKLTAKW